LKADTENEKSAKVSKNAFPTLMLSANACERIPRQKRTVARFTGMWYIQKVRVEDFGR
jgi:predicted ATPase with chaperone activity